MLLSYIVCTYGSIHLHTTLRNVIALNNYPDRDVIRLHQDHLGKIPLIIQKITLTCSAGCYDHT